MFARNSTHVKADNRNELQTKRPDKFCYIYRHVRENLSLSCLTAAFRIFKLGRSRLSLFILIGMDYMPGPEEGGGHGAQTIPLKNDTNKGFLSNTRPDPLKNYKATKPAFDVGPTSA